MNNTESHKRTVNYFLQIRTSFVVKVLAIACSYVIVPIMLRILGTEQYGIWSTLLSIMSWIVLFDLGIGNGLKNKIAESIAKNEFANVKEYISTAYIIIGIISFLLFCVLFIISKYIAWQRVFNSTILNQEEIRRIITVTGFFFFLNFWLSLINQVVNGFQKTSISVFNQFSSNLFFLILLIFFETIKSKSMLSLSYLYGVALVTSSILISIWFFRKNTHIIPSFNKFKKNKAFLIANIGMQFFVIQIAVVVLFTSSKILITQLIGPEYVVQYDLLFKLFSIILFFQNIIMTPLWPAYTDAYHQSDFKWIRHTIKKQLIVFVLIVIATIILALLAPFAISIWISPDIEVNGKSIIAMSLFVVISSWNNVFAFFLNGVNQIKEQVFTSLFAIFFNFPLSIFLVKYFNLGVSGIIFSTSISLLFFSFVGPIKSYIFLRKANINE